MTGSEGLARGGGQEAGAAPDFVLEQVRNTFEELGLNGHQARVLLALLRLGTAGPAQLARLADIHRTSAYPVLQELRVRGLAQQVPDQPGQWTSLGVGVLDRLLRDHEERLRRLTERVEATRAHVEAIVPASAPTAVPYIQIVATAPHAREVYDRLLATAEQEFLVLSRPPYSAALERSPADRESAEARAREEVNPAVLDALGRGVRIRVLYEGASWEDPAATAFRAAMGAYHAAGVEGRLVDELPMKLVIADRRAALFALADPVLREVGFPMNVLVEHAGYCSYQADAFDRRWAEARPVD